MKTTTVRKYYRRTKSGKKVPVRRHTRRVRSSREPPVPPHQKNEDNTSSNLNVVDGIEFYPESEDAYTDDGTGSTIYTGEYEGMEITIYPLKLYNKKNTGWEYKIYNTNTGEQVDGMSFSNYPTDHAKTAKEAMERAANTVKEWG